MPVGEKREPMIRHQINNFSDVITKLENSQEELCKRIAPISSISSIAASPGDKAEEKGLVLGVPFAEELAFMCERVDKVRKSIDRVIDCLEL